MDLPTDLPADLPTDIRDALARRAEAAAAFGRLPPSHKREVLRWIDEAKQPATRLKRIAGMIERLVAPRSA